MDGTLHLSVQLAYFFPVVGALLCYCDRLKITNINSQSRRMIDKQTTPTYPDAASVHNLAHIDRRKENVHYKWKQRRRRQGITAIYKQY